jgi:uncharacterized protein (DUF58 family)
MKFLDPVAVSKLASLQLRARCVVEGLLTGLHDSPYRGHSLEFSQHREYSAGDELRHIDWKVYGRSDRFFVKQFQDETNLRAYLLLDASGSMEYGAGGRLTKLQYASHLAAALSYLFLRQEDAVALGIFDRELRAFVPPQNRLSHLSLIFEKLERTVPGGETGISAVLKDFGRFLKKRGLVIILSDLLDEPDEVLRVIRYFRYRHHEVIVLQVLDPDERQFPFSGEQVFAHCEKNEELSFDADDLGAAYRELFGSFLEEYKGGFRRAGIDYHTVMTDMPFEQALGRIVNLR